MDTEQRYLRDIRDAIRGVEKRSSMQSNGNEKAKYLKDIADAIRENGGGGPDGNDKVKQTPIQNGVFDVLLSKSASGEGEKTEGANKSQKYKLKCSTHGGYLTMEGPTGVGDNTGAALLESGSNPGVSAQKITTVNEGGTSYQRRDAVKVNIDDIVLSSNKMGGGSVDNPNTWDGTNTSLKAAIANAKSNDIFVFEATPNGPSLTYDNYTSDTSGTDIIAAYEAGKTIFMKTTSPNIRYIPMKQVIYVGSSTTISGITFEDVPDIDADTTDGILTIINRKFSVSSEEYTVWNHSNGFVVSNLTISESQ